MRVSIRINCAALEDYVSKYLAFVLVAVLFTGLCCVAQSPEGAIVGTVTDPSGARIAGAKVTATARGLSFSRTAQTSKLGEYRLAGLPPGAYDVKVEAQGFSAPTSSVAVTVSGTPTLDLKLQAATVQETVNVQGKAESITG